MGERPIFLLERLRVAATREERMETLIAPMLESMGYGVVRIAIGGGGPATLQVMAERLDAQPITVDECADISRAVSGLPEVDAAMAGAFVLEVSSPGIDRPLLRIGDYDRFAGRQASLETVTSIGGRRRFRGVLKGVAGECVRLGLDGEEIALPFSAIAEARLVVNEAAIAASLKRSSA
jgi:ribosome maturation factor RimP